MLDGFGHAPVCLGLDLDGYDGPWTHPERFRGQSGWLVVAEAALPAAGRAVADYWLVGQVRGMNIAPRMVAIDPESLDYL